MICMLIFFHIISTNVCTMMLVSGVTMWLIKAEQYLGELADWIQNCIHNHGIDCLKTFKLDLGTRCFSVNHQLGHWNLPGELLPLLSLEIAAQLPQLSSKRN